MKNKWTCFMLTLLIILALTACTGIPAINANRPKNQPGSGSSQGKGQQGGSQGGVQSGNQGGNQGGNSGGKMGGESGGMMGGDHAQMHAYHLAQIPPEYANITSSIPADAPSISRGQDVYTQNCASCHGDGGMGDGPAGAALQPPPSPVAQTSTRLGDNYLFWRVSEGGVNAPAPSAMPAWKDVLEESERWNVINYVRALGTGQVQPNQAVGGATFDPSLESAQRAEMLAEATQQGLISQAEADTFEWVHTALDDYLLAQGGGFSGRMEDIQAEALDELVKSGVITQAQADTFLDVHERLLDAGLMH